MPYHHMHTRSRLKYVIKRLEEGIYTPAADLQATAWITPEPVSFDQRMTGEQREIIVGQSWGQLWDCAWFRFQGQIPQDANGQNIVLLIDLSGEGCVFDSEGCPLLGLTTQSSTFDFSLGHPGKRVMPVSDHVQGGQVIDIWVEAGNNDLFGRYQDNGILKQACIASFNQPLFDLYHDFYVLYDLMDNLPRGSGTLS